MKTVGARVLVGHEFTEVVTIERPSVDHLFAMGIYHGDDLPGRNERGLAAPCRNFGGNFHPAGSLRPEGDQVDLDDPAARKVRDADRGPPGTPGVTEISREDRVHRRIVA